MKNQVKTIFRVIAIYLSLNGLHEVRGQENLEDSIQLLKWERADLQYEISRIDSVLDPLLLKRMEREIQTAGYPVTNDYLSPINGEGFILGVSSKDKFPVWSMHVISTDLLGPVSRNRINPKINHLLDSVEEKNVREKDLKLVPLIPYADVKWSATLTESLNNMVVSRPMKEAFYDRVWSELESFLRDYFYYHKRNIIVVTGYCELEDKEHPEFFFKAAIDVSDSMKKGIAFLVPHRFEIDGFSEYVLSIDSLEVVTGINFFSNLSNADEEIVEQQSDMALWTLNKDSMNTYLPLNRLQRPKKSLNTNDLVNYKTVRKRLTVCGTVAESFTSSKGHAVLSVDEPFPNQLFSFTILHEYIRNFSYEPTSYLMEKKICVTGRISEYKSQLSMLIEHEKQIEILD